MSLDCDASDRTFDWRLAYLGLLADAAPLFREGSRFPVSVSCSRCRVCSSQKYLFQISFL
jgi:hypothetical protein